MLAAIGLNLVILGGVALLYRAFTIGTLSVISPIAASFGAITTALSLISGERPSVAQLAGIAVTLVGVGLTGAHAGSAHTHVVDKKRLEPDIRQRCARGPAGDDNFRGNLLGVALHHTGDGRRSGGVDWQNH